MFIVRYATTEIKRKHPQLFVYAMQLSDGSLIRHTTLTPGRPLGILAHDASSHPSWNPRIHNQILSAEHEGVLRFKNRFSEIMSTEIQDHEQMTELRPTSSYDDSSAKLGTKDSKIRKPLKK